MINDPIVMGNIQTWTTGDAKGTWGVGAPMSEISNREAGIGNAISTVATLLDIPTPTPNDPSFVQKVNGKAVAAIKTIKNSAF